MCQGNECDEPVPCGGCERARAEDGSAVILNDGVLANPAGDREALTLVNIARLRRAHQSSTALILPS